MAIADKIRNLRKQKGWSQGELSQKLGYFQSHVNRWENNKKFPSIVALKKLSKLFNISLDVLVFDDKDIEKLNIEDKTLASKLKEFSKLSTTEKQSVIMIIDSLLKSKSSATNK